MLLPLAVALALANGLAAAAEVRQARTQARLQAALEMRDALERAFATLTDRHERALRHVREVLHDDAFEHAAAALQWTAVHYDKDLTAALAEASRALSRVARADADARLGYDLARLQRQVERIGEEGARLTPRFEALAAAHLGGDRDAVRRAERDLDRGDRLMHLLLRTTDGMARSACSWQAARAGEPRGALAFALLLLLPLLTATGVALALRPLRRLQRLAVGPPPRAGHASRLEAALAARLRLAEEAQADVAARLDAQAQQCERAQALARRHAHDLAVLRLYNDNLVNSLRSAVVVSDAQGTVTSVNRTARLLLGAPRPAADGVSTAPPLLGSPVASSPLYAALAARAPDLGPQLEAAMRGGEALRFEAVGIGAAAREVLVDITVAPYQDESGAARGLLWVADDVTDAVHTKHQLLLAERLAAVGRLSAQVAHEIRNPLSAIGLNAELLEEEFLDGLSAARGAEAAALLHAIGSEVARLTGVTETYLQMARLPHPNVRQVDLNELLADLFVMLGEEMKAHGIAVSFDLGTPAPQARVDPGQIRQALINIVRNGREAMARGGALQVVTGAAAQGCFIEVSDSGPGIATAVLPRVFEPFYSTKPQGTGLGLSLTQQIIAEHGGAVSLHRRPHGGTRVRIGLPAAAAAADEGAA